MLERLLAIGYDEVTQQSTAYMAKVQAQRDEVPGDLVYNPSRLLDAIIEIKGLRNDAALSRLLEVAPPVISKIRHGRLPVGAALLIRMHETTDVSIRDLRYLMGDRRRKFRISPTHFKPQKPEGP